MGEAERVGEKPVPARGRRAGEKDASLGRKWRGVGSESTHARHNPIATVLVGARGCPWGTLGPV